MEEEEGGGRLGKRLSEKGGEVDYKTTAGTAWSHSFLNQKPWHPLSYPNQRRKWIAEQTHANRSRRSDEVAREFAQEQEFFRQTALFSKKEKEKVEMVKAVSFMYVRPPGYNAESAKAAEVVDERKRLDQDNGLQDPTNGASIAMPHSRAQEDQTSVEKKPRPKDVFGRTLPTEEEFEVLKNAPRLETGVVGRIKPFAVEIRNVRCVRCGAFGHQSGDRECPLKDTIMPNDESRLKRDDPLTAIMAQSDSSEPLKWELKQKPGMSPPRGGYQPDDPNQQIVADDIFDEYGGFLTGGDIPTLLSNSGNKLMKHSNRKSQHERRSSHDYKASLGKNSSFGVYETEREKRSSKSKEKKKPQQRHFDTRASDSSDSEAEGGKKLPKSKRREKQQRRHLDSRASDGLDSVSEGEKRSSKSKQKRKQQLRHSDSKASDISYFEVNREKLLLKSKQKRKQHRGHSDTRASDSSDSEAEGKKRLSKSKQREKLQRKHLDYRASELIDSESERKKRSSKSKTTKGKQHRHHSDARTSDSSDSEADSEVKRGKRYSKSQQKGKQQQQQRRISGSCSSDSSGQRRHCRRRKQRQHMDSSTSESSDSRYRYRRRQ